ncbi:MAG: SUMF1/EgtB/PvdO family nonheme iron enzyme, partial [Planctomycetota bacterium]|nr:SUMF1/EgtB/PvdO family nonheme iron enzyme [Planctomycetota bacterium]
ILPLLLIGHLHSAEDGRRWALVIGINDYELLGKLEFCRNDAEAVAESLVKYAGYDAKRTLVVSDGQTKKQQQPTFTNLRRRIEFFTSRPEKGDTLLVFFAGHGVTIDGKAYLMPVDGNDEHTGFALSWLKDRLDQCKASQKILILDACHSGKAARGVSGIAPPMVTGSAATLVLASCAAKQVSYPGKDGHGIFTGALLKALTGVADKNRDKTVTASELFGYIKNRLEEWEIATGKLQTPQMYPRDTSIQVARVLPSSAGAQTTGQSRNPSISVRPVRPKLPSGLAKHFEIPSQSKDAYGNPVRRSIDKGTGLPHEIQHKQTGMHLVFCPAGTFMMGSPANEKNRTDNETQHRVTLSKPFFIGKYEVTQAEWTKVVGDKPWEGKTSAKENSRHAVSYVSWEDCQGFLKKAEGALSLPSEAEWEYACRAGTTSRFSFGDDEDYGLLKNYAWFSDNAYDVEEKYAHPVGGKKPNQWGLYDMHGNVFEWCQDWIGDYPSAAVTNPTGPNAGEDRVIRGGSWYNSAGNCRSANRFRGIPGGRDFSLGFRVALLVQPEVLR